MTRPLHKIETSSRRLPNWFRKDLSPGREAENTEALLSTLGLHTICESGRCPNRNECYSQRTATFMILGDVCTRSCGFCSVSTGKPEVLDLDEPRRLAEATRRLGLKHVVVTSVTRDDLPDEGAGHFLNVLRELRKLSNKPVIEILTPDFKRTQPEAVAVILQCAPDVFSHNVETVPGLYITVRRQANYTKSLSIFRQIKSQNERILTKSGLMLGLGESRDEVLAVLKDLRDAGCELLTLGQYLQSSTSGFPVKEYVTPDTFLELKKQALAMGFRGVESGPFVRSSFHAKDSYLDIQR